MGSGLAGLMIVAAFADLGAARRWAEADPYRACGAYASVEVQPFRRVLP